MEEQIHLDTEQQQAYDDTTNILKSRSPELFQFFVPVPSIVELPDVAATTLHSQVPTTISPQTIITPTRGHAVMGRYLEEAETLEKTEATLVRASPLSRYLMAVLTAEPPLPSSDLALETLAESGKAVPRRVCQHPFKKNDIVWVCRTCQADETCVLCHACFSQSNHEGHDVAFYHAQAGGCCDCGDPDGKLCSTRFGQPKDSCSERREA
jgi:hypothetical protein